VPNSDLRARLQRLRPATRKTAPPAPPESDTGFATRATPRELVYEPLPEAILPGQEQRTPHGAFQLIEERYPLDHQHGHWPFSALLSQSADVAARLARTPSLAAADLRQLAFIDTETTGLAGGTGTLAFLIGVGVFDTDADQFVLRQYFLRQPDEEQAALSALLNDLAPRTGWVTFNGRAFDVPILEARLTLNRQPSPFRQRPHLDLLTPARWLYRGRLESCALSHLEAHVLGVPRTGDDVPGYLIPQMYLDYLRSGDARDMRRVIYHNAVDILSMVTLSAHLMEVFATQVDGGRGSLSTRRSSVVGAADYLRLARWHEDEGREAKAEAAYRQALAGKLSLEDRQAGLERLAALLKRLDRREEAVPLWEQLASFSLEDSLAYVELAKYYEWKAGDIPQAIQWTERALALVRGWEFGWKREAVLAALQHRLERLREKRGPG
jgi:hypothetical protein